MNEFNLLEPLQYEFFIRGIVVAILVGGMNGLLGVYIVMRGMSYIGHGLSHAVFGGAVVSHMMSINIYIGALLWGVISSIVINRVSKNGKVRADAVIGIISTTGFAIGIFLISSTRSFTRNFEALLFGNILGITYLDMLVIALVSIVVFLFFFLLNKMILFMVFDRDTAKVYGVKTDAIDLALSTLLAIVIIASMNVIGVTLLAAAIVTPTISARLLTNNFNRLLVLSTVIGALTASVGMYLSFLFDSASGATIVLFSAGVFGAVALYTLLHRVYHEHSHGRIRHRHMHIHKGEHDHEHHH
ncbi:MAG: iron chelate uptake ABC transporter family permease subunit [Candidatus Nitrosocaldus sp.]